MTEKPQEQEEKYSKLDPGTLLHQDQKKSNRMDVKWNTTMILRRRARPNKDLTESTTEYEVVKEKSPSFIRDTLPVDELNQAGQKESCSKSSDEPTSKRQKESNREKIFSITSSGVMLSALISIIGLFGLCISAQYSNFDREINENTNLHNNQLKQALQHDASPSSRSRDLSSSDAMLRQMSIDRFDSGNQIKPPLIGRPTTVAPMLNQQDRTNPTNYHLQAEASQDSYLTPEEREQWLQSQDNHYQGKNTEQQQPSLDSSPSERELADNQNSQNQLPLARPQTAGSTQDSNDADDNDYEDDGPSSEKANLVPERRRTLEKKQNYNDQRRNGYRQPVSDPEESADQGEDYDGVANDDSNFKRRRLGPKSMPINEAASYNQQNGNIAPLRSSHLEEVNPLFAKNIGQYENAPGTNSDDSEGFGPGPNEAYLVDRVESERPDSDSDSGSDETDAMNNPIPISKGSNIEPEVESNKFDRRIMDDQNSQYSNEIRNSAPTLSPNNPINHQVTNLVDNNESRDTAGEDSGDSDDEAGSASAPSAIKENFQKMSSSKSSAANRFETNDVPKTDPTSRSTTSSESAWLPKLRKDSLVQKIPDCDEKANFQQTTSAPYNPQNNPSHAGKYFIN